MNNIGWCDRTANPLIGCTPASEGCANPLLFHLTLVPLLVKQKAQHFSSAYFLLFGKRLQKIVLLLRQPHSYYFLPSHRLSKSEYDCIRIKEKLIRLYSIKRVIAAVAKFIALTQGKFAQVDDELFDYLSQWTWCYSQGYAKSQSLGGMHREVLRYLGFNIDGLQVDHINRDTLDNRVDNLRVATHQQNTWNRRLVKKNTSGCTGVSWDKKASKWRAYIKVNQKVKHLGFYVKFEDACEAAIAARIEAFGDFFQPHIEQENNSSASVKSDPIPKLSKPKRRHKGPPKAEKNPNWKGGRHIGTNGYVKVLVGTEHHLSDSKGYAYEHRLIAEQKLGRKLKAEEQVHHINGNKTDNRPENLEVVPNIKAHQYLSRKTNSNRRKLGEENPLIECSCGCGIQFKKFDSDNRPRLYVSGHNSRRRSNV